MLFDSHAHYDDTQFDRDRDDLLSSMEQKGISYILNAGIDLESSRKSLALTKKYPFIYAAVGFHPHEAKSFQENLLGRIEEMASDKKAVAIGEIGLDYHYDFSPRDRQKECFFCHMELAKKLGLPVVIHEREAAADCFDMIKNANHFGVYHCYSGSLEMAKEILKRGYYLSFTGAITFPNAKKAVEVIRYAPMDRIMIETDCPYMAPVPFRGRRNDSGFVGLVAERIAEIKGVTEEEVAYATLQNAKKLFSIE